MKGYIKRIGIVGAFSGEASPGGSTFNTLKSKKDSNVRDFENILERVVCLDNQIIITRTKAGQSLVYSLPENYKFNKEMLNYLVLKAESLSLNVIETSQDLIKIEIDWV